MVEGSPDLHHPPKPPSMTREQYGALVARVEGYARRHPLGYKIRLGLLALFGYAYIWLMLLVIAACLALLVLGAESLQGGAVTALIKLGWPLLVLAYAIVRALWVRFPPPEGVEIRRVDAPRLFALVDQLRAQLECPRFHHVLLSDEWNAGVSARPRLGPFGWYENYLQLGVPLMSGLGPDEFRAVLAHEFGHLSRSHGRFGSWIYRVRTTWSRLLESLHQTQHRWRGLFEAFLNRFAPYFNAYSFVLARAREYEADRVAAELAGRETMGRALVNLALGNALLAHRYWPSIGRLTGEQAEPPAGAISSMADALRAGPPPAEGRTWLEAALRLKTDTDDTHPCLSERLGALGLVPAETVPRASGSGGPSAADDLLGAGVRSALARLDAAWREQTLSPWRDQHAAHQRARARLEELDARAANGALAPELAWERVELTLRVRGDDAAEPLLRDELATNPQHAGAHFLLGRILLERSDAAGVEHFEQAMRVDPGCVPAACDLVATFHAAESRDADAQRYRARAVAGGDLLDEAENERQGVSAGDRFLPHDLPAEEVERLRGEIAGFFDVRRAWLARKAVTHLPEIPLYVLGVEIGRWYQWRSQEDYQQVVHGLATKVAYPGRVWILHLGRRQAKIAKKLKRVPGAEIFRR